MGLVRFTSKAAGEIFMFEDNARRLFEILGKDATPKGIITAAQVPEAIARLRAAVDEEKRLAAAPAPSPSSNPDDETRADHPQFVSLGQRAYPLLDMLERAARKHVDVLWGV